MLYTHKILAAGCALGDLERDLLFAGTREAHLAAGECGALAVHFEPHGAAAVESCGCLAGGDFGHVELEGTRVRDGRYGCEADGIAGVDGCCDGGCGARGELVAADLVGGNIGHGTVGLVVCCLACGMSAFDIRDARIVRSGRTDAFPETACFARCNELRKCVVSAGRAGDSDEREDGGLHFDVEDVRE
jgi:hypothetical protein